MSTGCEPRCGTSGAGSPSRCGGPASSTNSAARHPGVSSAGRSLWWPFAGGLHRPRIRPFGTLAFRRQGEACGVRGAGGGFDGDAGGVLCRGGGLLACVAVVGPGGRGLGVPGVRAGGKEGGRIVFPDVGGGDEGVHEGAVLVGPVLRSPPHGPLGTVLGQCRHHVLETFRFARSGRLVSGGKRVRARCPKRLRRPAACGLTPCRSACAVCAGPVCGRRESSRPLRRGGRLGPAPRVLGPRPGRHRFGPCPCPPCPAPVPRPAGRRTNTAVAFADGISGIPPPRHKGGPASWSAATAGRSRGTPSLPTRPP